MKISFISVRVTDETRLALAVAAQDEGRSISNLVNRVVEEWLKSRPGAAERPEET